MAFFYLFFYTPERGTGSDGTSRTFSHNEWVIRNNRWLKLGDKKRSLHEGPHFYKVLQWWEFLKGTVPLLFLRVNDDLLLDRKLERHHWKEKNEEFVELFFLPPRLFPVAFVYFWFNGGEILNNLFSRRRKMPSVKEPTEMGFLSSLQVNIEIYTLWITEEETNETVFRSRLRLLLVKRITSWPSSPAALIWHNFTTQRSWPEQEVWLLLPMSAVYGQVPNLASLCAPRGRLEPPSLRWLKSWWKELQPSVRMAESLAENRNTPLQMTTTHP